jgi:hypothetical protein
VGRESKLEEIKKGKKLAPPATSWCLSSLLSGLGPECPPKDNRQTMCVGRGMYLGSLSEAWWELGSETQCSNSMASFYKLVYSPLPQEVPSAQPAPINP